MKSLSVSDVKTPSRIGRDFPLGAWLRFGAAVLLAVVDFACITPLTGILLGSSISDERLPILISIMLALAPLGVAGEIGRNLRLGKIKVSALAACAWLAMVTMITWLRWNVSTFSNEEDPGAHGMALLLLTLMVAGALSMGSAMHDLTCPARSALRAVEKELKRETQELDKLEGDFAQAEEELARAERQQDRYEDLLRMRHEQIDCQLDEVRRYAQLRIIEANADPTAAPSVRAQLAPDGDATPPRSESVPEPHPETSASEPEGSGDDDADVAAE